MKLIMEKIRVRKIKFLIPLFFVLIGCFITGCAHHYVIPFSSEQAIKSLNEQSDKIQTARGRAWVSVRAPEGKFSFPAILAIDRTNLKKPLFRLEAVDLFGSTHVLLILDKNSRLTWIDYDQKEIRKLQNHWYGLPLSELPNLILGAFTFSNTTRASPITDDSFQVRVGNSEVLYLMTWIDPGPRLALAGLKSAVHTQDTNQEKYFVKYSHFLDYHDFYLPQEEEILGFNSDPTQKPVVEIHITWRERHWNEKIPSETFQLPRISY